MNITITLLSIVMGLVRWVEGERGDYRGVLVDTIHHLGIKCVTLIDDEANVGEKKLIMREINVQIKYANIGSENILSDLLRSENCGIFVTVGNKNTLETFLENLKEEKSLKDIFKIHSWFLLTAEVENHGLVFRFDSQVFLISTQDYTLYETYRVGARVVTRSIGRWSPNTGTGR